MSATDADQMKTTLVIAEDAPVGVLLWPVRSAEFAPNFTLASVTRTRNTVVWTYENGTVREFLPGEQVACEFEREIFQRGDVVQIQDRDRDPQNYPTATVISTHWRNDEFGYMVRYDNDCVVWVRDYDVLALRTPAGAIDFAVGDIVHVENWGEAEFRVTGHSRLRDMSDVFRNYVDVARCDNGWTGHELPEALTKIR